MILSNSLPIVIAGFILIWALFSYYTLKVTLGIKKALGSQYYTIPNRWKNIDNPETREAIETSPELSKAYKLKIRLFITMLVYMFGVLVPAIALNFYFISAQT